MKPLLFVALLAAAAAGARVEDTAGTTPKVDGKWLIVYGEEGGRRNTAWEAKVATLSDNVLSYERDGKKQSLKLTFAADQKVKASFTGDGDKAKGAYSGVYIAGRDYLCLSLNSGDKAGGKESSGSFILILRRQREK